MSFTWFRAASLGTTADFPLIPQDQKTQSRVRVVKTKGGLDLEKFSVPENPFVFPTWHINNCNWSASVEVTSVDSSSAAC